MGQNLTHFTIGKVHYNFCFINFAWKWLTMVQEAHGAQVLLDPDYRPKNVLHSNKNTGVCYILSFIMFSPKHTAAEPPHPILGPITPGFVSGLSLGS